MACKNQHVLKTMKMTEPVYLCKEQCWECPNYDGLGRAVKLIDIYVLGFCKNEVMI